MLSRGRKEEESEQEENWMMAMMVLYNNNGKTILKDTVHMSTDGSRIIVGAWYNDSTGTNSKMAMHGYSQVMTLMARQLKISLAIP